MGRIQRSNSIRITGQVSLDELLGFKLRRYRGQKGMTIDQLAEAVGVIGHDIADFEAGRKRISASLLFSLAKLLGVQVGAFFTPMKARA